MLKCSVVFEIQLEYLCVSAVVGFLGVFFYILKHQTWTSVLSSLWKYTAVEVHGESFLSSDAWKNLLNMERKLLCEQEGRVVAVEGVFWNADSDFHFTST